MSHFVVASPISILVAQATTQASILPSDPPPWVLGGGASALGLLVIWWMIRTHIPGLTQMFAESLSRVLADSKANRDAFEKAAADLRSDREEDRQKWEEEARRQREEATKREQVMVERLDAKNAEIIRLVEAFHSDRSHKP